MGDTKRKRKLFSRPKKLFDRARMDEENVLIKRYGLKNKREIWKAKSAVSRFRRRAKSLIGKSDEEQRVFFDKLNKIGLGITDISDILALTEENVLMRRLQTFVFKKKLANTVKEARQLITHKNILVDGKIVNIPSFVVTTDLEDRILLKEKKVKVAPEPTEEEAPVETAPLDVPENSELKGKEEANVEEKE